MNFRFTIMKLNPFWIFILIIILLMELGCGDRNTQNHDSPPAFEDIIFPEDGDFIAEGRLIISGTLVDDTGFHPEEPISLEVGVSLGNEQTRTFIMVLNGETSSDYSFFKTNTGEFVFNFDDVQRMKPGIFKLTLQGMDSAGNVVTQVSSVTVGEFGDVNLEPLIDARNQYGKQILNMLGSIQKNLGFYGEYYSYDLEIIDYLKTYVNETYITRPVRISEWVTPMDNLVASVTDCPIPDLSHPDYQDYLEIKPFVIIAVNEFQSLLEDRQIKAAYPWYPDYSYPYDIPDLRPKPVDHYNSFSIVIENDNDNENFSTCIVINSSPPYDTDEIWNVADFTIVSDPESPLEITGFIGSELNRITIEPEHYDPPLRLFNLFYETGVDFPIVLKIL